MAEIVDFDQWIKNYKPVTVTYAAIFDPQSGKIRSVGPKAAFTNETNIIDVDTELAESIIGGSVNLENYAVDISSGSLQLVEVHNPFKIDDMLHRIVEKKWSTIDKPDIYLLYDSKNKQLIFELSEEYGGTKLISQDLLPVNKKNIVWDTDTKMDFLITGYNDPNMVYELLSVKIQELKGSPKIFKNIDYSDFSIYTRRLFKNYVIEII